jgi:D-arabinose 1-dehydrogenase-like Zn-dependent alcohol dehydrogenase
MEALRFVPGEGLALVEMEVPTPGRGEVLIEVHTVGLCGSDVAVLKGKRTLKAPVVLGHEISGTIVAVGTDVPAERGAGLVAGQRTWVGEAVVVAPIVVCEECPACVRGAENLCVDREVIGMDRDGGLARFVVAPSENALRLPDGVAPEFGALAVDAVATPFHALKARARLVNGDDIAILGVGGLGQHAVQLAAAMTRGAVVAVDVREGQLELARRIGATAAVPAGVDGLAERLVEAAGGQLDVILDCAGVGDTLDASLAALRPGGRAVRLALEYAPMQLTDPMAWVRSELSLVGSYGFTRFEIIEALDLIAEGRLRLAESISHRIRLGGVERALKDMAEGLPGYRRVIVSESPIRIA